MEWQRTVATPGVAGVAVFVAGVPGGGLSGALTFTVTPAPAKLSVDPPSITLLSAGGASPPAQIISVLDSGGGSLKWSAQTRVLSPTGDNGLAAPNAGSSAPGSPGLISVTADPTLTLAPVGNGYYAGANPVFAKIPNLGATAIVNAASYAGGALAQGSIFSLFGTNIAGASTTAGAIPLPATLSGASVTIGGIPAPIFYAGAGQVNAQVPFELPPNSQQQIRVSYQQDSANAIATAAQTMNVAASQPGIFTLDSSGSGPGHVYIGTTLVNSANPAHPANLVTVFTTGLGPTTPPVSTNTQTPGNVLYNAAAVTATIGGVPAKVTFAGLVPGFVGLYQVNLQIPTLATGTYDLIVIAPTGLQSNTVPVPVVSP